MSLHIIDWVNVTVDCREDDARAVQQLVSAAIRSTFTSRAAALFDTAGGDRVIDCLEVEVGACTLAELSCNLVDATLAELRAAINGDARRAGDADMSQKPMPLRHAAWLPERPADTGAGGERRSSTSGMPSPLRESRVSPETKRLVAWLEDHLSRRRGARPSIALRKAIFRDCRTDPAHWAHFLAQASLAPIVHDRLLRAFDPGERRAIVAALLATQPPAVRRAMAGLSDIWPLQPVLIALISGFDRGGIGAAGPTDRLMRNAAKSATLAAQFAACRGVLGGEALAEAADRLRSMLEKGTVSAAAGAKAVSRRVPDDIGADPVILTDAIGVDNAGTVLLWPFLPRFFDALELVKDGSFVDTEAARRAAALLDGLISGDSERELRRTGLTAMLCGLDPDQSLGAVECGKREQELFGDLLTRVTMMAPSLRKLSGADLIALFLRRPGSIGRLPVSAGFVVTIEPHPADILLAELPWPLEAIALPWSAGSLTVRWPWAGAETGAMFPFERPGDEV